jgi:hypothetical protein|tara:strand:+ start:2199 stop:2450 length:252 start_codon:yes stop_codon:yes gene_type:complete
MTTEEQRGDHAKTLLEDYMLDEAFEAIRGEILSAWEHSDSSDASARETAYISLKLLSRLRIYFENVVTTGEFKKAEKGEARYN